MNHPVDRALALGLPVVSVPTMSEVEPIAVGKQRLLVAQDGLYAEARSEALHIRWKLAPAVFPTAYGRIEGLVKASHGQVATRLVRDFVGLAMASPEVEVAGVVEQDAGHQQARLRPLDSISSSGGHITYADGQINDERLLIDLHSHGRFPAGFSNQDDDSDRSRRGPYVAVVVGRCDSQAPEMSMRLVVAGTLLPVTYGELAEAGFFDEA